jgi:2-dehydro-3-deoxygalactonokinase
MLRIPADTPARLIAVDWGTSRFRAVLLGPEGEILAEAESDDGIASLGGNGHAEVFARHCGSWRAAHPGVAVLLAGMVGSRNGWLEASYVACPASLPALASGLAEVPLPGGGGGAIVPGVLRREGRPDVMRGEEILAFGAAMPGERTVLCLPGTHSKWVSVEDGRITDFTTFVTGELYGLLVEKSFIGSLAVPGASAAAFAAGLAAAAAPEGLLATLFTARAGVLAGALPAEGVRDYLSGLVIGRECIDGRAALATDEIVLIAAGDLAERYRAAASASGLRCRTLSSRDAFIAGALRIATEAGRMDTRIR